MASISNFDLLEEKINELVRANISLKSERKVLVEENELLKDTILQTNYKIAELDKVKTILENEIKEKNNRINELMKKINGTSKKIDETNITNNKLNIDDIKIKIEDDKLLDEKHIKIETLKPIFSNEKIEIDEDVPKQINFYLNSKSFIDKTKK